MSDATPPRWVAASWRLSEATPPSEGLSVGRVVQAGIEVADEQGLPGLSLRRLGEHLGAGTMAAYRHIESKNELIMLMIDTALGAPPADIAQSPTWQIGVARWAAGMSVRYRAHPWLLDAPIGGMPMTPNRLLWFERILQPLDTAGLVLQNVLDAALLIDGHVRNLANLERELKKLMSGAVAGTEQSGAFLTEMLDRETFPMTLRVIAAGSLADDTGGELDFGLARIIAGIEDLARSK